MRVAWKGTIIVDRGKGLISRVADSHTNTWLRRVVSNLCISTCVSSDITLSSRVAWMHSSLVSRELYIYCSTSTEMKRSQVARRKFHRDLETDASFTMTFSSLRDSSTMDRSMLLTRPGAGEREIWTRFSDDILPASLISARRNRNWQTRKSAF